MEINEMNYELYALDYAEGRLTGKALEAFEEFLSGNPEMKAELLAISETRIPEDAVIYSGKEKLKHDRGVTAIGAIRPLWPTAAIAASLVLALGLLWSITQQSAYGELASTAPAFTLHYSLEFIYQDSEESNQRVSSPSLNQRYIANNSVEKRAATNSLEVFADAGNAHPSLSDENFSDVDREQYELVKHQEKVIDQSKVESEGAAPFKLKMTIVNPADVPVDNYYVLPVTIELYDLTMEANNQARGELDRLAASDATKAARRKLFKDGALSLLQETLVPEGINNLLNN